MRHIIPIIIAAFIITGCGVTGQSVDMLYTSAESLMDQAKNAGAEQYASAELREAQDLLAKSRDASGKNEKRLLIQKASAKARLAEAASKQAKTENQLALLEKQQKIAEEKASAILLERKSAESTLEELSRNDTQNNQ